MAGLFGWLKRGNNNNNTSQGAYFLDPDDAKTYGDIEYMRKSKTVRRTFPKTLANKEGGELIQEVSSEKMVKKTAFQNPNNFNNNIQGSFNSVESSSSESSNTESSFVPSEPQKRRSTDTNMDMFRNMAKGIRK
ncbi:hypothetical protein IQ215_12720 [Cyanobacterium stanieri LEGE 03274]|uniref:Uncharacterized protein n=1 Tax=Cyanobacterium stanieri LEGE 03274 TaxID=1828756 RepID=A0ABR9V6P0_9CHRO|nr:hypothetical protein [Cyanobacterium stanieri]MBE9223560.1 hypothetical protein [Cyanobacterium stanieri LEGE 03274]